MKIEDRVGRVDIHLGPRVNPLNPPKVTRYFDPAIGPSNGTPKSDPLFGPPKLSAHCGNVLSIGRSFGSLTLVRDYVSGSHPREAEGGGMLENIGHLGTREGGDNGALVSET